MRRTPLLVLIPLVGFSISCGDVPTAVQDDAVSSEEGFSPELRVAGKESAAEVSWGEFEFVPFPIDGFECGENVLVRGFFHTVRKTAVDGKPNQHGLLTVNAQGVGVGELTGAKYIWADKVTSYHFRGNGKASGFKEQTNSRLIGQGSVPNAQFSFDFTFIQNANGVTTVEVSNARQICK